MRTFICKCGCEQTGTESKWRKKSRGPQKYLPGHCLKLNHYHSTTAEPNKMGVSFKDRVTPEQIAVIKQMYNGHNRKDISKKLGIPKTIINFVVLELGIDKGEELEEGA